MGDCKEENIVYSKERLGRMFKKEWFSMCSEHQVKDENCPFCQFGCWHYVWLFKLDVFLYKYCLWLWKLLVRFGNWRRKKIK